METAFHDGTLQPKDLKHGVSDAINVLLDPNRELFTYEELVKRTQEAYKGGVPPSQKPTGKRIRVHRQSPREEEEGGQ